MKDFDDPKWKDAIGHPFFVGPTPAEKLRKQLHKLKLQIMAENPRGLMIRVDSEGKPYDQT